MAGPSVGLPQRVRQYASACVSQCCSVWAWIGGRSSAVPALCRRTSGWLVSMGLRCGVWRVFSPSGPSTSGVCRYCGVGKPSARCSRICLAVLSAGSSPAPRGLCRAASSTTANWWAHSPSARRMMKSPPAEPRFAFACPGGGRANRLGGDRHPVGASAGHAASPASRCGHRPGIGRFVMAGYAKTPPAASTGRYRCVCRRGVSHGFAHSSSVPAHSGHALLRLPKGAASACNPSAASWDKITRSEPGAQRGVHRPHAHQPAAQPPVHQPTGQCGHQ